MWQNHRQNITDNDKTLQRWQTFLLPCFLGRHNTGRTISSSRFSSLVCEFDPVCDRWDIDSYLNVLLHHAFRK